MNTNGMTYEELKNCVIPYLTEYEQDCLQDIEMGFGCKTENLDTMLHVWYGEETESFLNTVSGGYYYSE